jgi:UDP:flavonoid glycosyltransferase YjiC (YdhE family)
MTKPILLFAPETFNIAETTRMIEVAKAAQSHFAPHFMGYGGAFVHLIQEAGFPFHLLEPRYTQAKIEHLWKVDRMEAFAAPFTVEEVRRRVRSELDLYNALQPRAIVIGFTLTVYLSARIAGIPLTAVTPFAFTRPFLEAGLGAFPDQFRRGPLRWIPRSWLDRPLTWWALHTKAWTQTFNTVMKEYGQPPFPTLMALWEADHMLVAEIPQITGVAQLPQGWHYVGPIFAHLPGDVPQEVEAFARRRPLIYCAMGSSGNRAVVKQVIEAFAGTPYAVIAPVAAHLEGANVAIPANVLVTGWLPAPQVNALADVAVIHGGQGTVQTACASGTPFVGIGMQPEQEWNIDCLVRQGCARRLGRHEVTRQRLITAIEELLHDTHARQIAKEIQSAYSQWNGAAKAAEFLIGRFG